MRALLTYLTFPVIMGGTLALTLFSLEAGWSPSASVFVCQLVGILAIALTERVHPYHREWLRSRGDMRTDTAHAIVNAILTELVPLVLSGFLVLGAAAIAERAGGVLWPTDLPLLAQLLLALVVGEFGVYWIHRLLHEIPWLWPIHAPHHSPTRLYWLNAARFHPIDIVAQQIISLVPVALLGAPVDVLVLVSVFTAVHGMFQHCNIEIRLGPLNHLFSMAELHRWHHSKSLAEANTNYGANLIIWDTVFGSRFLPSDREPPVDIGIADMPDFPPGYIDQLRSPFRWSDVVRESSGEESER